MLLGGSGVAGNWSNGVLRIADLKYQYSRIRSILKPLLKSPKVTSYSLTRLVFLDNLNSELGCHIMIHLDGNLEFAQALYGFI
jgi:hypothetical protein